MSTVISFESRALDRLRARVAQLDEANADLLAYARGHAGAVAQIHAASLAAMEAADFAHLVHVVTADWTDILGIDAIALGLETANQAWRGETALQFLDRGGVDALLGSGHEVTLRSVDEGAPLFGPAASLIRSEALVRLPARAPVPQGLLALGSRQAHSFEGTHGAELLIFLGGVVARMLARLSAGAR
ncbi:MAG: DUF484 family protein [Alphaproteobacteria bacterium]|nr:DUF484 family protein [Alphaproteobacteria bacterium]